MRPNKEFKPGPSLEGTEAEAPRRVFRKGRFMGVPEGADTDEAASADSGSEVFVVDLTQEEVGAVTPAEVSVAAGQVGTPISKYEARSLSPTVNREVDSPEPAADTTPPIRIEIDIAEPADTPAPARAWTSESSLEGDRYWRKDSRR